MSAVQDPVLGSLFMPVESARPVPDPWESEASMSASTALVVSLIFRLLPLAGGNEPDVYLHAARMLDVVAGRMIPDAIVHVRGKEIVEVGGAGALRAAAAHAGAEYRGGMLGLTGPSPNDGALTPTTGPSPKTSRATVFTQAKRRRVVLHAPEVRQHVTGVSATGRTHSLPDQLQWPA
jgi:hypothetical protein